MALILPRVTERSGLKTTFVVVIVGHCFNKILAIVTIDVILRIGTLTAFEKSP